MPESNIFMTGSTGTIGRQWLASLLNSDPSCHVNILVRDAGRALKHPRVTPVLGNLCAPQLALTPALWSGLAESVTDIIHCGADVRFHIPLEVVRAANAEGTRTVLGLARSARKLRRFVFVGTTYIMGRDSGELQEGAYRNSSGFMNPYEQSKYEAEQLVFGAMTDVPAAVFRISLVAGEESRYLEQVIRLIPRNPFPIVPAIPHARIDMIDTAWAVMALGCLFERHFRAGAVYHVCAGPEASISVPRLMDMAFSTMRASHRPIMSPLDEFEAFARKFLENGERELDKVLLRLLSSFLPHLALDQSFRNYSTAALLHGSGISLPDSRAVASQFFARIACAINAHDGTTGRADRVTLPTKRGFEE